MEVEKNPGHGSQQRPVSGLASRLRRITTSGLYVPEIDGLRFIAIVSVVLFHISAQTGIGRGSHSLYWSAVFYGHRGVPLFFAISGFILGLPFANQFLRGRKPVSIRQYFLRRLTRLEPPYILVMVARALILVVIFHRALREILPATLASLVYLHNLIFAHPSFINPPAWSLEVEVQFYCLAPLLARLYFSIPRALLRRAVGVAVMLFVAAVHDPLMALSPRIELSLLCTLQYFLAGFLLVDFYIEDWDRIPKHILWDAVSLVCWPLIFLEGEGSLHFFFPLLIVVAYVAAFKGHISSWFFRLTWISLIGGMCYSIYLTHTLAITATASVLNRLRLHFGGGWELLLTTYLFSFVAVTLIGISLYVLIERPCMDKNWPAKLVGYAKSKVRRAGSEVPTV